jgi:hypothetical protein
MKFLYAILLILDLTKLTLFYDLNKTYKYLILKYLSFVMLILSLRKQIYLQRVVNYCIEFIWDLILLLSKSIPSQREF